MRERFIPDDRQVFAECQGFEIVRYDRRGHWYVEPRGERPRQRLSLKDAVIRAESAEAMGGVIHFNLPGGQRFDSLWRKRQRG